MTLCVLTDLSSGISLALLTFMNSKVDFMQPLGLCQTAACFSDTKVAGSVLHIKREILNPE